MKVKATAVGFFEKIREPGEVFDVTRKQFSENWMEKYTPPEPEEEPAPDDESEAGSDEDKEEGA